MVSPDSLLLLVGQTGQLSAQVTNASNTAVGWSSSNTSIATVDANGLVTGRAAGSTQVTAALTAQPSVKDSALVRVTAPAATLVLDSVRMGSTRVTNDSVRGTITAHYKVDNIPAGQSWQVQFRIDTLAFQTFGTVTGSEVVTLSAMVPSEIVLSINTAELNLTTGVPRFFNGPHSLSARLAQPNGSATAQTNKPLIFFNQNLVSMTTNGPQSGIVWRGNDLIVNVTPVIFSAGTQGSKASVVSTRASGTGNLAFNQQQIATPAVFTVNPSGSANTEGVFNAIAQIFDANNNDITSTFGTQTPLPIRLDNLAPRIAITVVPLNLVSVEPVAVRLAHAAGTNLANSVIPTNRFIGLQDIGPHAPNCPRHGHGSITVINANGIGSQGPFQDPEFTVGDPCGWGPIGNFVVPFLSFNFGGSITDPNLDTATLQLVRAVGSCDTGVTLTDDIPLPPGNGIGQSPTSTVNLSQMRPTSPRVFKCSRT